MKKLLLGAAAALAVAAPGIAAADTSGNIDFSLGATEYDGGGEFDQTNLGGAVQFDTGSSWTVQLDGRTSNVEFDGSGGTNSNSYAAVHATTNGGAWDFGGWAGLVSYYGTGGWTIGGETRTSFGNFSVQGSLGYSSVDSFTDIETMSYQVGGAYFFSPNFAINANVARHDVDAGSSDIEMTDLGVGAAYGFGNGFEVYGGYVSSDIDFSGSSVEADTWNLGLRYHFNGGSLQDNANDGASWSGVRVISDALGRLS